MSLRIYAMYLQSKMVLVILVLCISARVAVGLAVAVVIFGPHSGISGETLLLFSAHGDVI